MNCNKLNRMPPQPRFFPNSLPDYTSGDQIIIDQRIWHGQITALIKVISDKVKTSQSDGTLYVGSPGIVYMLYYAASYEPFAEFRHEYLQLAKQLLQMDLQKQQQQPPKRADTVSFLCGPAGLYAVGAFLGSALRDDAMLKENLKHYKSIAQECLKPKFLSCGSDELFVGRAGYLCGALALEKQTGHKVLDDATINNICATMLQSGKEYVRKHKSHAPLMYAYYETEYLGAAHGLSSILQMMLSCPSFLKSDASASQDLKSAVDWMLSLQQPNGNFPPAMDEVKNPRSDKDELVHWCHGAPGVVYLLAKAFKVWGEQKYLDACVRCAELTWQRGLLTKGPGICHGVAGSGYVFLLLYRLTNDRKYLYRANQFANFMSTPKFQDGARTPDHPYSLYEGLAGTVCFMIDLLQPEKAAFPFFDVD